MTVPVVDGIPRFPVPADGTSPGVFDRLAPIYESPAWFEPVYRVLGGPNAPRDDREPIAAMLEAEGADVLDVACGTGRISRRLARHAAFVTGVDVSEGMLETAARYAARDGIDNLSFARMDGERLWFDPDTFDRVACCWALHVFPNPRAALSEVHRVLRPGGLLAGTTIVERGPLRVPGVRELARGMVGAEPFTVADLRERLARAGFADLKFDRRGAALFFRARAE